MAQPTVARWRRGSVAAKIETTYGTDPTLAAADIIWARNIAFKVNQEQVRDERIAGLLLDLPDIPGARSATLSFETILRGAAAAYSATVKPEVDALLRGLGLAAAGSFGVGTEKWDYTPQGGATIGESVTAALFAENSVQGKLLGAFGTGRLSARAGGELILAVTLTGLYVAPAAVTLITGTVPAVQPPIFKSGAVTVGAVLHKISTFDLDVGNDVQVVPSANDAQAVGSVIIAGRRFGLTMDPEAVVPGTYDWHAKRDAPSNNGQGEAAAWQVGTVQYNRAKFSAPRTQVLDISETQRNGIRAFAVAAKLNATSGSDELTITFD